MSDEMRNTDDIQEELERLRAENEALKARKEDRSPSLKVSEKGGVSLYGLGRFPVTLYKEQWLRLLDMSAEIRSFIEQNDSKLKTKSASATV
jgi:hypothetical protein